MPELPEIETVKLQLQKVLPGRKIVKVEVLKPKSFIGNPKLVEGKKVLGVKRIAKVIIVDPGGVNDIAIHFKMTGQLIFIDQKKRIVGGHPTADFTGPLPSKHTRVIFHLDRGTLYFNDQRIFGWVMVIPKSQISSHKFLGNLGPDALEMKETEFIKRLSGLSRPIKLVLMDQTVISGVGNIYANDACWEARVDPRKPANTLTRKQYQDLYTGLVKVLKEGIKYGGATASDAKYIDLSGMGGHYQDHFRVYDRTGNVCLRPTCRKAGAIIKKITLGGRGTYYCPNCQK